MGLERSQIGDQPALHVEAEGAIMVILPGSWNAEVVGCVKGLAEMQGNGCGHWGTGDGGEMLIFFFFFFFGSVEFLLL
jgi:hypothetical protein